MVEATQARLVALLSVQLGNRADAEDVAQEAYLRAWSRIGNYDPELSFRTWLFTIARRLGIGRLRKQQRRPACGRIEEGTEDGLSSAAPCPGSAFDQRDRRLDLWSKVRAALGSEIATALWLRYAEDLSSREIGRVLGKREGAVRTLLQRARERLALQLAGERPSDPAGAGALDLGGLLTTTLPLSQR